jgi:cell division protein FtsL
LNREQRTLQAKIDEFERELEGERTRKRALEREINELSL